MSAVATLKRRLRSLVPQRSWIWLKRRHVIRRRNAKLPLHDAALVSFPKAGRTWLRLMVAKSLCTSYRINASVDHMLDDLGALVSTVPQAPRILVTHDESPDFAAPSELETDKRRYQGVRVAFLVRDPRDLIVSLYFQKTKREGFTYPSIDAFVRGRVGGLESVIAFYNLWWRSRQDAAGFHLIRYEDLRRDTAGELSRMLLFWQALPPEPAILDGILGFASFDNMRRLEASGSASVSALRNPNQQDPQAFKTREGKIGAFRTHLSAETCAWMEAIIAAKLDPAFGYATSVQTALSDQLPASEPLSPK